VDHLCVLLPRYRAPLSEGTSRSSLLTTSSQRCRSRRGVAIDFGRWARRRVSSHRHHHERVLRERRQPRRADSRRVLTSGTRRLGHRILQHPLITGFFCD
jgi:hypothetical protein